MHANVGIKFRFRRLQTSICGAAKTLRLVTSVTAMEFAVWPGRCRPSYACAEKQNARLGVAASTSTAGSRRAFGADAQGPEWKRDDTTVAALLQKATDVSTRRADCFALIGVFAPKPASLNFGSDEGGLAGRGSQADVRKLVARGCSNRSATPAFKCRARGRACPSRPGSVNLLMIALSRGGQGFPLIRNVSGHKKLHLGRADDAMCGCPDADGLRSWPSVVMAKWRSQMTFPAYRCGQCVEARRFIDCV